jgi:pimeloyl-ACP methyl ester carboxylesterase
MTEQRSPVMLDDGSRTRLLRMSDGRNLAVSRFGDPEGAPVILFHGSPGSRIGPVPIPSQLEGINLITFDRPGYGHSDPISGRTVADIVPDVRELADVMDLGLFNVVGRSGGAKFALACAALLPDRVPKAIVMNGRTPYHISSIENTGHINKEDLKLEQITEKEAQHETERLTELTNRARRNPDTIVFPERLSPADRADIASVPNLMELNSQMFQEALRQGPNGLIEDTLSTYRPWGFNLDDIEIPVRVYHGVTDHHVPFGHGRLLVEMIPNAEFFPNDGTHFKITQVFSQALSWLRN